MSQGESLVYDGKTADFLVNFQAKKRQLEELSSKDVIHIESDESHTIENPLIVHYDHTEDKGRVFGASHVPLPFNDEDSRQKKMDELKDSTVQTNLERVKRKKLRNEKKAGERRRLNRLRLQKGLPPVESSSDEECESSSANVVQVIFTIFVKVFLNIFAINI